MKASQTKLIRNLSRFAPFAVISVHQCSSVPQLYSSIGWWKDISSSKVQGAALENSSGDGEHPRHRRKEEKAIKTGRDRRVRGDHLP